MEEVQAAQEEAGEAAATARISIRTPNARSPRESHPDSDESRPQLRPQDLEDLASIFDRIRVLYRKKEDQILPPPKKLIAKGTGKVDDLAIEFDQKLTSIMITLSGVLQDPVVTSSQKLAEIEKSKFLLYNFCCETIVKYLAKHKASITGKDAKELHSILSKVREGLSTSFKNLGTLFYSKEEQEVQATCGEEMERITKMMEMKEAHMKQFEQSL
jgi:hypothetical protein